ncbi:MAG: bifunctional folylpolyglutamate synthase/dihydrofolate synthase [Deltaproteobacteria bacterium RIFOXYD12_FULL_57_12]|nr:MAG: bifunctional folylpolyglutamate synthase/dihydrofolate synthase [Deltaproteobacteria bacterium RIFOXYD12_FULL_57_12]
MTYQEAWDFLDQLQFFKIKLGLDSMTMFLAELGNPQDSLLYVHVAGTNGKGSVSATLLTLLARAGYKVGLYTSPHLTSVRERFMINGVYISEAEFAAEASRIRAILRERQITYFEFTTALALLWFARQRVDLVILEVGLGGRLDATNVITPLVSIITNVAMDHEAYLGDTLAAIAVEKAGIIKPGVPVVSAVGLDGAPEPLAVVRETCGQQQAPLYLLGEDFQAEPEEEGAWAYWGMRRSGCCLVREKLAGLVLNLKGDHQRANAALALATLDLLQAHGFRVSAVDIRAGLLTVRWPGRLEYFRLDRQSGARLPEDAAGSIRYLLDGAHNPAGVKSLVAALLRDFFYKRLILVWGAMADKDIRSSLAQIAPLADVLILTRPPGERSASPEQLLAALPEMERGRAECVEPVDAALARAAVLVRDGDLVCVAGSLYLIGAARVKLLGPLVAAD